MKNIQVFFAGVGRIVIFKDTCTFRVDSLTQILNVIIPHFEVRRFGYYKPASWATLDKDPEQGTEGGPKWCGLRIHPLIHRTNPRSEKIGDHSMFENPADQKLPTGTKLGKEETPQGQLPTSKQGRCGPRGNINATISPWQGNMLVLSKPTYIRDPDATDAFRYLK